MVGDHTLWGARRRPNHATGASNPRAPELPRQSLARSRLRIRGVLSRTPQEAKPEYACQGGHIRSRSRHLRE